MKNDKQHGLSHLYMHPHTCAHALTHTCTHVVRVCKCSHSCHNMHVEFRDQLGELNLFLLHGFHRVNKPDIGLA